MPLSKMFIFRVFFRVLNNDENNENNENNNNNNDNK